MKPEHRRPVAAFTDPDGERVYELMSADAERARFAGSVYPYMQREIPLRHQTCLNALVRAILSPACTTRWNNLPACPRARNLTWALKASLRGWKVLLVVGGAVPSALA